MPGGRGGRLSPGRLNAIDDGGGVQAHAAFCAAVSAVWDALMANAATAPTGAAMLQRMRDEPVQVPL